MKKGFLYKLLISFTGLVIVFLFFTLFRTYRRIYYPNVITRKSTDEYIYIRTGASFEEVMDSLYKNNYIIDKGSFEWLAEKKNYKHNIHPGRYRIRNNMSNNDLINLLRSGKQEPVKVIINKTRSIEELAGKISRKIEADSLSLVKAFRNNDLLELLGFNSQTVAAMIIPNTYKFFWNTSAEQFVRRMHKEYLVFWNKERLEKAQQIGFTPLEVTILASIVSEETMKPSEDPVVAGVYINRLKKGMKLQADPTVKYAIGDFSLKRIFQKHLQYDSPYNTYLYKGLPPSPICIPEPSTIDAVLNYQKHDYLYFCAKDDLSGYHVFAKTLKQHNKNARAYQQALNRQQAAK